MTIDTAFVAICNELLSARSRIAELESRQPQSVEWVPWKEGDPLPVPGEYVVLRDHRRGENDSAKWAVIAECVQLPSGELTWWPKGRPMQPVVAYLPTPLPDPYTDAQGKRDEK